MHALCASSHSYSASLTVRAMQNSEAALASLLLQVEGIHGGGDRRESGSKQPCDSIATTLPLSSLAYANIVRLSLDMPSRRRPSWLADEPHTTRRGRAARPAARVRSSHSPLDRPKWLCPSRYYESRSAASCSEWCSGTAVVTVVTAAGGLIDATGAPAVDVPHAEQLAYDVLQQHAKEVPCNACGSPPLWVCRKATRSEAMQKQ